MGAANNGRRMLFGNKKQVHNMTLSEPCVCGRGGAGHLLACLLACLGGGWRERRGEEREEEGLVSGVFAGGEWEECKEGEGLGVRECSTG